jgi:hypothetical protein
MTDARFNNLRFAVPVLLLAAVMFISGSAHYSAWSDEGWNLWVVRGTDISTIFNRLAQNHHPPAYFLGLAGWQHLAGESRIALRFISILGAMLSTALIYHIGADHFGKTTGIMGALLFAVFEQSIYYAQAMRHYGWLILGVCFTTFFFLRYLRKPRTSLLIGYSLSVAFTLYTMYLGVFVIAIQGLVGILLWRGSVRDKVRLMMGWVGAGALLLPWFLYALPSQWHKVQRGVIGGYHNSFSTTPENVLMMSELIFGGQFVIGAGLCVYAIWQILKNRSLTQLTLVLSGIGLFALLLVVNLRIGLLAERTLFFLLPAVVLTIGFGFQLLQPRLRGLLAIMLVGWMMVTVQNVVPRINSDIVARTIAKGYSPHDLVLLETGFDDVAYEYELELALPSQGRQIFRSYYEYDYPSDDAMMARLNEMLQSEQRVWVVNWNLHPRFADLLVGMGFQRQERERLPVGINDPIYEAYPEITLAFYTRPVEIETQRIYGELFALEDALFTEELQQGQNLHIDLWWSLLEPVDRDYSIGVYLLDQNGVTQLQQIGPEKPTTTWRMGEVEYNRHTLPIRENLPSGEYQIIATVYWYQEADTPLEVENAPYAVLGNVTIRANELR